MTEFSHRPSNEIELKRPSVLRIESGDFSISSSDERYQNLNLPQLLDAHGIEFSYSFPENDSSRPNGLLISQDQLKSLLVGVSEVEAFFMAEVLLSALTKKLGMFDIMNSVLSSLPEDPSLVQERAIISFVNSIAKMNTRLPELKNILEIFTTTFSQMSVEEKSKFGLGSENKMNKLSAKLLDFARTLHSVIDNLSSKKVILVENLEITSDLLDSLENTTKALVDKVESIANTLKTI